MAVYGTNFFQFQTYKFLRTMNINLAGDIIFWRETKFENRPEKQTVRNNENRSEMRNGSPFGVPSTTSIINSAARTTDNATMRKFERLRHIRYFTNSLQHLPTQYSSADTNRLTLVHFCVHCKFVCFIPLFVFAREMIVVVPKKLCVVRRPRPRRRLH